MKNYLKILSCGIENLGLKSNDDILKKFEIYTDYLLDYNYHTNLTAIIDENEIIVKHYLDSISILRYTHIKENAKVIDIGTGAGFPLLPCKIMRNDIDITLLDSLNKRVTFLENLVKKLNIEAEILHARAEEYAKKENYRESYDFVFVRAVANLNTLIEYSIPYLKIHGKLIALKGEKAFQEIEESKNSLKILKSEITDIIDVDIKEDKNLNHKIIIIEKLSETPDKYPRSFSKIKKNPL